MYSCVHVIVEGRYVQKGKSLYRKIGVAKSYGISLRRVMTSVKRAKIKSESLQNFQKVTSSFIFNTLVVDLCVVLNPRNYTSVFRSCTVSFYSSSTLLTRSNHFLLGQPLLLLPSISVRKNLLSFPCSSHAHNPLYLLPISHVNKM